MEARSYHPNTSFPRDFTIWFRGGSNGNFINFDEDMWTLMDYYSVLVDVTDGSLKYKYWLRSDPEPAAWTGQKSIPVQSGSIGIILKAASTFRIYFASIAFNGEDPDRPV